MQFIPLGGDQQQRFAEDGFLVVKKALSLELVERLIEAGDRIARPFLDKPVVHDRPEYNYLGWRPGLLREPAFFELVACATVVPLIVQFMGPNIHLHSTSLIYKRPEARGNPPFRRGWHRDIRIAQDLGHVNLPLVGIKVIYCMTGFHAPDSGMTLMVRGSHRRHRPLVIPDGHVDPIGVEVCDLQASAGDAILFENRLFHTAAPNLSDHVSKVVIFGYSYRWMKQEIYLDPPNRSLLAQADPITRQLLGGYQDIDTRPWDLQRWARRHGVDPGRVPWSVTEESDAEPR